MKKLIIHIGMHKTGSSSIQETFALKEFEDIEYLNLGSPNHSGFFATLFWEHPEKYHGNIKAGRTTEDVYALREEYRERLLTKIAESKKNTLMISAEDLSHPGGIDRVVRLKEFFQPYIDEFKVYAYVRSPVSYMESAFQQMVKGGVGFLDVNRIYPNYRSRFEVYDQVFGKENVNLIPFDKTIFYAGDVVVDLAYRLGETIASDDVVRVNESLSLEATSLIYVYRKCGPGYGSYKGATQDNNKLINVLRSIAGNKLKFHKSLVEDVLKNNESDLEWIENRVSHSFDEELSQLDTAIRTEQDLIDVAQSKIPNIFDIFKNIVEADSGLDNIARLIDSVRYYLSSSRGAVASNNISNSSNITSSVTDLLDREGGVNPPVVFREMALAFERGGDLKRAKKILEVGLKVNPNAPGLLKVYERLVSQ